MNPDPPLPHLGRKAAAWLRHVGVTTREDLAQLGPAEAYARIRRAGFTPSLTLVYALEGALRGCHWQTLEPATRKRLGEQARALLDPLAMPTATTAPPGDQGGDTAENDPA